VKDSFSRLQGSREPTYGVSRNLGGKDISPELPEKAEMLRTGRVGPLFRLMRLPIMGNESGWYRGLTRPFFIEGALFI